MSEGISLPIFIVDAFANHAFAGNPAGVCLVAMGDTKQKVKDEMLQKIGGEMKQTKTAFVITEGTTESFKTENKFHLRWFTPTVEVPMNGHGTLCSASVLFTVMGNLSKEISFETLSGTLIVKKTDCGLISMDFPLCPSEPLERHGVDELLQIVAQGSSIQEVEYSDKTKNVLIRMNDSMTRDEFEKLTPDTTKMAGVEGTSHLRGVIITLKGSKENGCVDKSGEVYNFVSRFFGPWIGVPEDPVSGFAHTMLASYWSEVLNTTKMYARQCSTRGGEFRIEVQGDRVQLAGEATVVVQGTLSLSS